MYAAATYTRPASAALKKHGGEMTLVYKLGLVGIAVYPSTAWYAKVCRLVFEGRKKRLNLIACV